MVRDGQTSGSIRQLNSNEICSLITTLKVGSWIALLTSYQKIKWERFAPQQSMPLRMQMQAIAKTATRIDAYHQRAKLSREQRVTDHRVHPHDQNEDGVHTVVAATATLGTVDKAGLLGTFSGEALRSDNYHSVSGDSQFM